MASLQARHQRDCAIVTAREAKHGARPGQWSTFAEADKKHGCTCTPLYHVVLRHNGKLVRESVGHSRKEAQRALDARRGDVARRTYKVVQDIAFQEWADTWLAGATVKENSRRVYAYSLNYAKMTFGAAKVRDLTTADIRRFQDTIRKATLDRHPAKEGDTQREVTPATLAKHLRQLGACLQAAVAEGYATDNPIRQLHKTARPKVTKSRPAYYTNAELSCLWPELAYRPVMLAFCRFAAMSGARFGELAALRWTDCDLLNREIHIARTVVDGAGEQSSTKSGEPRTLDLTPPAAKLLEDWYAESGGRDGLVFEREEGGHLTPHGVHRPLYAALDRAGVPRVGERGRKRDFHSFRHSFARVALEGGAEIVWVQKQLGHSSIQLTVDTYGSWSRVAQKAQAERLAEAFTL